jgi:hypothetical protein
MSENTSTIDAAMIDRLVDGELEPRLQAELLSRLDEWPGAWRRLALAFVEAQTLGAELRGIVADAKQSPGRLDFDDAGAETVRDDTTHPGTVVPWAKLLSLAATMLIAVGMGFGIGQIWRGQNRPLVENPSQPASEHVATTTPASAVMPAAAAGIEDSAPQGLMTVRTADGSPVQLPVYEASYGTGRMLNSNESSVPPEVIHALRSRGHEVKQQRRFWPVDLGDGRQIIVPVDQLDVQYVGDRAYQ